jgi:hypothetical protein
VIGGVASGIGASEQSGAARDAANTSAEAAKYQADIQKQIYDQARADQAPWRETGSRALDQLAQLTGLGALPAVYADGGQVDGATSVSDVFGAILNHKKGSVRFGQPQAAAPAAPATPPGSGALLRPFAMSDFEADPGYAFRQAEGMKAIERSAAARGGALSGGAVKAAERFGQGLASEEYGRAFDRYNTNQANTFNRLASLAGLGQTANAATGAAGSNYANAITGISQADAANQGNALLAAGNARASGYLGIGNALGGGLGTWGTLKGLGYIK